MNHRILVPLTATLLGGCGTDPLHRGIDPNEGRTVAVEAALGDTIRLRPGQVAQVGTDSLRVQFIEVELDSRCPRGVECVWAGDAAVALRLSLPRRQPAEVTLHTNDGPAQIGHAGHLVSLIDVEPYPVYQERIAPGDYVAVLRVTRS